MLRRSTASPSRFPSSLLPHSDHRLGLSNVLVHDLLLGLESDETDCRGLQSSGEEGRAAHAETGVWASAGDQRQYWGLKSRGETKEGVAQADPLPTSTGHSTSSLTQGDAVADDLEEGHSGAEEHDGARYEEDVLDDPGEGEDEGRGAADEEDDRDVEAERTPGVGEEDERPESFPRLEEGGGAFVDWDQERVETRADLVGRRGQFSQWSRQHLG